MSGFRNNTPERTGDGRKLNPLSTGVARYFLNGGNINEPESGGGLPWSANNSAHTELHKVPDYCVDELYLYASNPGSSNQTVNIFLSKIYQLFNYPQISVTVKAGEGMALILPGLLLLPNSQIFVRTSATDYLKFYGNIVRRYQVDEDSIGAGYSGDEK
jgi:hypothetical protein